MTDKEFEKALYNTCELCDDIAPEVTLKSLYIGGDFIGRIARAYVCTSCIMKWYNSNARAFQRKAFIKLGGDRFEPWTS